MSSSKKKLLFQLVKWFLKTFVYPSGSDARILKGPLKGLRLRVCELAGWAPIRGGWEVESTKLFERLIKPSDVIYDLGANVGIHSILFSILTGPKGRVFAFEPFPDNVEQLNYNIKLNNLNNVEVIVKAVSESVGVQTFYIGKHGKQGSILDAQHAQHALRMHESGIASKSIGSLDVTTTSLDSFISSGYPAPQFIKLDIEGAEGLALNGFATSIHKFQPLLYIELHSLEQDLLVGKFLSEKDYKAYRVKLKTRTSSQKDIFEFEEVEDYQKGWPEVGGIWGNILAIPTEHAKKTLSEINGAD